MNGSSVLPGGWSKHLAATLQHYMQTLDRTALSKNDLARLTDHIKLAERLGARIVTTHGEDVATQIAEYARLSGVTKIVIGRSGVQRRHFWNRPTLTGALD